MTKKQIISKVKEIILKFANPERIYLFGSQATGENSRNSDINIAYDDPNFKENYLIIDEVEKLQTLIKIDVKNIAKADSRFQNRVKSTGKVIFSASKKLRAEDGLLNFSQALDKFSSAIKSEDEIKNQGFEDIFLDLIVKRFEFTFEMAWKSLKRYLEYLGFSPKSPRATFKEAYAQEIIKDEKIWLLMIEQRNTSSHIYDESEISEILEFLEEYQKAFLELNKEISKGLNIE
jgi:nucleotidyltransferase substrate binding protein (TIGR01987 family)